MVRCTLDVCGWKWVMGLCVTFGIGNIDVILIRGKIEEQPMGYVWTGAIRQDG